MLDAPLQDIEISNFEDDDSRVAADFPLAENFGFSLVFPLVLVVIVALASALLVLRRFSTLSEAQQLSTAAAASSLPSLKQQRVELVLTKIGASSLHLLQTAVIINSERGQDDKGISGKENSNKLSQLLNNGADGNFDADDDFDVCYNLTLTKDEKLVKFITVGNVAGRIHQPIGLFETEVVNFDAMKLSMDITLKTLKRQKRKKKRNKASNNNNSKEVNVIKFQTRTINPVYSFFLSTVCIICSVCITPNLFTGSFNRFSLERKMTFFLSLFTLFYIDPFFLHHSFSPSSFHLYAHAMCRDLYFSFLLFYSLSLFAYFGRQRDESKIASLSLGILAFIACFALFVYRDASLCSEIRLFNDLNDKEQTVTYTKSKTKSSAKTSTNRATKTMTRMNDESEFDSLSSNHFIILAFSAVGLPVRAISAYADKKISSSCRYTFYTSVTMTTLAIVVVFAILDHFTTFLNYGALKKALPMTIFTAFALLMEWGHQESGNELSSGYIETTNNFKDLGSNPMGIDEDN